MQATNIDTQAVQVMLSAEIKKKFQLKCDLYGQSMSERAEQLVLDDICERQDQSTQDQNKSPEEIFSMILQMADEINTTSGYSEPSMEEIDTFIAEVRRERSLSGVAQVNG